jgi:Xaa-Pro aminopeptidase
MELLQSALREQNLDALVVSLPSHVLLLTGYYPVVGVSIAICTRDGEIVLVAPEDEKQFAEQGWAEQVEYFQPVTLDAIDPLEQSVIAPLKRVAMSLKLGSARIGVESGPASEPSSYSAFNCYSLALHDIARDVWPDAELVNAQQVVHRLCAVKTGDELRKIRTACSIAAAAFEGGRKSIAPGISEIELAAAFTGEFATAAASAGIHRQHAFLYCMSGPNSAQAYYAYAHSTDRKLGRRDWALVHCNSHVGGYWTDITRTYVMGEHTDRHQEMFRAVLEARDAAVAAVRPGVKASAVDSAAREVIEKHGFKDRFKHPTGHGVGFGAIDAHAIPRIHPKSDDVLEPGMVFNIEPAIYREGFGGVRQCEMMAVTETGAELLTPFHSGLAELVLSQPSKSRRLKKAS